MCAHVGTVYGVTVNGCVVRCCGILEIDFLVCVRVRACVCVCVCVCVYDIIIYIAYYNIL